MTAFDSSAKYYDAFANREGRLEREGPFLCDALRRAPGSRVVDIACGTGLHALFLAEQGAEVNGLDCSAEMIAYAARQRPHPRVRYEVGDMRLLSGGPWDLALCLGNSLALLASLDELAQVFSAVFAALHPKGLFAVQTVNGASIAAREPRHRIERRQLDGEDVVAVKSIVPHEARELLSLSFFIAREEEYRSLSETSVLLRLERAALCGAAESVGFEVSDTWGAYDRRPFDAERSGDIVALFSKPAV